MKSAPSSPETALESVRTHNPAGEDGETLCPVCQTRQLTGSRTVCSGACRARRWRQRRAGREDTLAELLREVRREAQALARRITEALG